MPNRRLTVIGLVVVALIAVGALALMRPIPSAHARSSQWILLTPPPPTLDGVCAFRVDITVLTNQEYVKIEPQSDGTTVYKITGAEKAALTNDATGKTVDYNISGPGTQAIYSDGSGLVKSEGSAFQTFSPAQQQTYGVPAFAYASGPITLAFDANGNITSFTHVGSALSDVCAALS